MSPGNSAAAARRPGRPVGSVGAETREAIAEAALECIAENGYVAATYKLVGARAGVSAASVQHYYATKEALFEAACVRTFDYCLDRWAVDDSPLPLPELLDRLLVVAQLLHLERPSMARFVATAPVDAARHHEIAPILQTHLDRLHGWLQRRIEISQEAGAIDPTLDSSRATDVLQALLVSTATLASHSTPEEFTGSVEILHTILGVRRDTEG